MAEKGKEKLFLKSAPEPILQKNTRERRSKAIWRYMNSHSCINVAAMCDEAGIDRGNFNKYWKGEKKLPQKVLLKVEKVLVKYGLLVFNDSH